MFLSTRGLAEGPSVPQGCATDGGAPMGMRCATLRAAALLLGLAGPATAAEPTGAMEVDVRAVVADVDAKKTRPKKTEVMTQP